MSQVAQPSSAETIAQSDRYVMMPADEFQRALAATAPHWRKVA